jgi:hypothetical protein
MMPPGMGGPGGFGMDEGTPLRRYDFILQFAWVPTVPGDAPKPAEGETPPAN